MDIKEIWINNRIIEWHSFSECGSYTNPDGLARAYDLWVHAESLITKKESELHLVDAISTLKRCVNQRLKFIEYVYNLKSIASPDSPKGYLKTFNLVRPFMLKKLMFIRNNIEHNDASPPETERCRELLDLTWYFLKSTDNILHVRRGSILFIEVDVEGNKTKYSFSLDIDFQLSHKINISGWLPKSYISEKEVVNYSKVVIETMHTKIQRWSETLNHTDKLDDDTWIVGELYATNEVKRLIFKGVLEAN